MADRETKITLRISDDGTIAVLDRAGTKLKELGGAAESLGTAGASGFSKFAASIITANQALEIVTKLYGYAKQAVDAFFGAYEQAHQINLLSQSLGINTQQLTVLSVAAKLAGSDVYTLGMSVGILSKHMLDGTNDGSKFSAVMQALGIGVRNADGSLRDSMAVMKDLADVYAKSADGAAKTGIQLELMGRGGKAWIPIMNEGREGIERLEQTMNAIGAGAIPGFAKGSEHLMDTLELVKVGGEGVVKMVAAEMLPTFQGAATAVLEWEKANNRLIAQDLAVWARNFGEALAVVLPIMAEVVKGTNVVADAIATGIAKTYVSMGPDTVRAVASAAARHTPGELAGMTAGSMEIPIPLSSLAGGAQYIGLGTPVADPLAAAAKVLGQGDAEKSTQAAAKALEEYHKQQLFVIDAEETRRTIEVASAEFAAKAAKERGADATEQIALAKAWDAAEMRVLETKKDYLAVTAANVIETKGMVPEVDAIAAEWQKVDAALQRGGEHLVAITGQIQKAKLVSMDFGSTISSGLERSVTGMLTGGKALNIGETIKGTGAAIAQEFVGGFIKAELSKGAFDQKIGENFTVTLPGFMKSGTSAISSLWSGLFGTMNQTTTSGTGGILSTIGNMVGSIGGMLRNVPGVGSIMGLFGGGAGAKIGGLAAGEMGPPTAAAMGGGASGLMGGGAGAIMGGPWAWLAAGVMAMGAGAMKFASGNESPGSISNLSRAAGSDLITGGGAAGLDLTLKGLGANETIRKWTTRAASWGMSEAIQALSDALGFRGFFGIGAPPTQEHVNMDSIKKWVEKSGVMRAQGSFEGQSAWGDHSIIGRAVPGVTDQGPLQPYGQAINAVMLGGLGHEAGVAGDAVNAFINNQQLLQNSLDQSKDDLLQMAKAAGIDLPIALTELREQFDWGNIGLQDYTKGVASLLDVFGEQLPKQLDVAAIALRNFHDRNGQMVLDQHALMDDLTSQQKILSDWQSAGETLAAAKLSMLRPRAQVGFQRHEAQDIQGQLSYMDLMGYSGNADADAARQALLLQEQTLGQWFLSQGGRQNQAYGIKLLTEATQGLGALTVLTEDARVQAIKDNTLAVTNLTAAVAAIPTTPAPDVTVNANTNFTGDVSTMTPDQLSAAVMASINEWVARGGLGAIGV